MAGVMQSDHRLHDGLVRERPYIGPEAAHLAQLLKRRAYFRHCRRVGQHRIDIPGFNRLMNSFCDWPVERIAVSPRALCAKHHSGGTAATINILSLVMLHS